MKSKEAFPRVVHLLSDPEPNARIQALFMLAPLGNREAVPEIVERLRDSDMAVRSWAATFLARLGAWDKAEAIARLLGDRESYARGIAAEGLGDLGAKQQVKAIAKLLRDKLAGTRSRAVRALGKLGATPEARGIRSLLKDKEPGVRVAAIEALVKLAPGDALSDIAMLLQDQDPEVRQSAALAHEELANNEQLSRLKVLLTDSHPAVRLQGATTLVHRGLREGSELLLKEYRDRRWPIPTENDTLYHGKTLRSLNVLRQPALYNRLRHLPMERPSSSTPREVVDQLAARLGSSVEWSSSVDDPAMSGPWTWNASHRPSVLEGLSALLQGSCESKRPPRYEFILENDRIRILEGHDALTFWEEWFSQKRT
jgi:hypothetical protein